MKRWIFLSFLWVLSLLYFAPGAYDYFKQVSASPQKIVASLKQELKNQPVVDSVDLNSQEFSQREDALLLSFSLYPSASLQPLYLQFSQRHCETVKAWKTQGLGEVEKKALLWLRYDCQLAPLAEWFFNLKPFEHPQGGSWVMYAFKNSKSFESPEFIKQYESRLHLWEWVENLAPKDSLLKKLDPDTLTYMFNRQPIILTDSYVLAMDENPMVYKVWPREMWDKLIKNSFYKMGDYDPAQCLIAEGFNCWSFNQTYVQRMKWNLVFFVLFTLGIFGFVIFRLQKEKRELEELAKANQQILVQTLAHELRHPATGIRLSMEVFRDQYDGLSDSLKEEFLRMTGQLQRLQRIIHASQTYLHSESDQTPFKFKSVALESFNDYLHDLLENYQEKIEVVPLKKDAAFSADTYWLGMCITNLVKNALTHGQKPIRVIAESEGKILIIKVEDSGKGLGSQAHDHLNGKPQQSTTGSMGLGLSLVVRIIKLMGGSLHYQQEPRPTFIIRLEVLS